MNLLLDSHVFVWMRQEPHRISVDAIMEMLMPSNRLFLSNASIWELQIKIKLEKFSFSEKLEFVVNDECQENDIEILPVSLSHIYNLADVAIHHKDPFDRMLISQAMVEDLTIVTRDERFSDYDVKVLW